MGVEPNNILDRVKRKLTNSESNSMIDEDKGSKKPFKLLISFMGDEFDFFDVKRIERTEPYEPNAEEGIAYAIKIHFKSYPFNKEYQFEDELTRENMMVLLADKLEQAGAIRI